VQAITGVRDGLPTCNVSAAGGLPMRIIGDDAMAVLQSHGWPGNVRQLRNIVERLLILASDDRPLDFHSRAVLNEQILASSGIDDHHIFPAKFLDDRGIDPRLRDCVLNRCLIDSHTNQRISCRAPSDYMADLRNEPGFPMETVLTSHLIPHGAESGLWGDDFELFLRQRLELIGHSIKKVTEGA
jgi:hypothetical protein